MGQHRFAARAIELRSRAFDEQTSWHRVRCEASDWQCRDVRQTASDGSRNCVIHHSLSVGHLDIANRSLHIERGATKFVRRKRETEVQSLEQRTGVDPLVSSIGVTSRRLIQIKRLTHLSYELRGLKREVHIRAKRANGRHRKLERRLDLSAISFLRVELR